MMRGMPKTLLTSARSRTRSVAIAAVSAMLLVVVGATDSIAANSGDFTPGRLISDQVFFDSSSMTAAQIQTFLAQRGAACTSGTVKCIKDFKETTTTRAAEPGLCATYAGAASESAAAIIYKVANACGVNPRVLLVTLEKEQGLITTKSPTAGKYRIAMGFGCPDTAACDSQYYGFSTQVWRAARQFIKYRLTPKNYNFQAGQTETIAYNPKSTCGSSKVTIQNQATASLYNYTPYQPNAAALKYLYTSVPSTDPSAGCASYGNRNFWRLYTDWFGSTELKGARRVPQRDFNRDALPDYFATAADGVLYSYYAKPGSINIGRLKYGRGWNRMLNVTTTYDLLRKSEMDLVAITSAGDLMIYPINTSGGAGTPVKLATGWDAYDEVFGGDDWGPSHSAVLFARVAATGELLAFESTGTGGLKAPVSLGAGWGQYDLLTFAHDFNNDGFVDVIARKPADNKLYLVPGVAGGGFGTPVAIGVGFAYFTNLIGAGDWNQDGNLDFLGINTSGQLMRFVGSGSGTIAGTTQVGRGWASFTAFP